MRIIMFFLFVLVCPLLSQGWASENTKDEAIPVTISFKENRLKHTGTGRVETIIDAHTVLMNDGKIIRLLGFDYPDTTEESFSVQGKTTLEKMMKKGDEFLIWQTLGEKYGRKNRMGHVLAHLQNKKTGEWMNGALIAQGLAYVKTDKSNADLAAQMYAFEDTARKELKGIWGKDSGFKVLSADTAQKASGTFAIVEGAVQRAATSNNNLYLNFGADSKSDFTVMITPALRKVMARRGVDALSLSGKEVRVRGWVRDWNGPFMELDTVERLEILSTPTSTDLSPKPLTKPAEPAKAGQSNP